MAGPPFDPYVRIPEENAYKIGSQDMEILRQALILKSRNELLEAELISLRQIIGKYQEKFGEL